MNHIGADYFYKNHRAHRWVARTQTNELATAVRDMWELETIPAPKFELWNGPYGPTTLDRE